MAPRWTSAEDARLRRLYDAGVPIRAIADELHRSQDAVTERRRSLGIPARPRARPWSPLEDQLLLAATANGVPAAALAGRLRRPADQICRRRAALVGVGRASRPYSPADDDAIRAYWGSGTVDELARRLDRSPGAIRLRAHKLGVHRPTRRTRWAPREDAAVRDGYERGVTCAEIAHELPGRTPAAVAARAAKLGLATYARAWTRRDDASLRRLAHDDVEIERAAQLLGRTPEALRARARKLGLPALRGRSPGRGGSRWTAAEDELLRLHAALNPAMLAELVDRSPEAVTQRLRRLGLRHGALRSPHHPVPRRRGLTPGERAAVVRELGAGGPRRSLALAHRLGVPPRDVQVALAPSDGVSG